MATQWIKVEQSTPQLHMDWSEPELCWEESTIVLVKTLIGKTISYHIATFNSDNGARYWYDVNEQKILTNVIEWTWIPK